MSNSNHICRLVALVALLAVCHCARLDVQAGKVVQQVRAGESHVLSVQLEQHAHWLERTKQQQSLSQCTPACMQLTKLASFSDDPFPAVTRILFTEADVQARK